MSPESPLFTAQIPTPESQGTRWAALQGSGLTLGQGCVRPSTGKFVRQSVAFRPTGNALTRSSRVEGAEVWGPTYCGRSHQFASTWPKTESHPPLPAPIRWLWDGSSQASTRRPTASASLSTDWAQTEGFFSNTSQGPAGNVLRTQNLTCVCAPGPAHARATTGCS